ncbi:MAG TPA: hypothetical protein VIU65_00250 [Pyrinomonadaceae bacterium]
MGYGKGQTALIAFQKFEGRKVTGRLNREEFDARDYAKIAGWRKSPLGLLYYPELLQRRLGD